DAKIYQNTGWLGRLFGIENPDYPPATLTPGSFPLAIQFGGLLYNAFLSKNGGMGIAVNQLPNQSDQKGEDTTHNYDAIPQNPSIPYQELDYIRTIERETEIYTDTLLKRSVQRSDTTLPAYAKKG